jgi:hypothetical protein
MGYYTNFTLSIVDGNDDVADEEIISKLVENEESNACAALNKDGSWADSAKWYNHEDDLREFSKLFPDKLFLLEGEGEESGDLWKKYFKNGKMQEVRARIVYDDFDPAKLTD